MKAFTNDSAAARAGMNLAIEPIEQLTYAGLQRKLLEVFELRTAWQTSTTDRENALIGLFGRDSQSNSPLPVTYPYGLLTLETLEDDVDRGNLNYMRRRGFPVSVDNTGVRAMYVKAVPTQFTVRLEYVVNDLRKLTQFIAAWTHARRGGWLNFNVKYGRTTFSVTCKSESSLSIPQREGNLTELKEFKLNLSLMLKSFISMPVLQEQQLATRIELDAAVGSTSENTTFWSFKTPQDPDVLTEPSSISST